MESADVRGLLSLLLADGSLVSYRCPGGGYVQLTWTAGIHESAFLEEKVAEFRHFIPTNAQIAPYKTAPRANGRSTLVLRFRVSTNRLRPLYNLLYPGGQRQVTPAALELLGGHAAAWLWAEGARPRPGGSVLLARVGQQSSEALAINRWLAMLTGAEASLETSNFRPRLAYSATEAAKLRQALLPYAPRSRRHLFTAEVWDECSIRSARTELLLGEGGAGAAGAAAAPVADPAALRAGADLPGPPAAAPAASA